MPHNTTQITEQTQQRIQIITHAQQITYSDEISEVSSLFRAMIQSATLAGFGTIPVSLMPPQNGSKMKMDPRKGGKSVTLIMELTQNRDKQGVETDK